MALEGGAGGEMMSVPGGGGPGGRGPVGGRGVVSPGPGGPTGPGCGSGQVVQYLTFLHRSSHKGWKDVHEAKIILFQIRMCLFCGAHLSLFILAKFVFIWFKCAGSYSSVTLSLVHQRFFIFTHLANIDRLVGTHCLVGDPLTLCHKAPATVCIILSTRAKIVTPNNTGHFGELFSLGPGAE